MFTAKTITDYLLLLKEQGKIIIFSTHILREAEKISDKIGIIHKGKLVTEGTFKQLKEKFNKTTLEDIFFGMVRGEN